MKHPRRVGINAIFLEPGMGGLATYVADLMPELIRLTPATRYTLLVNPAGRELLAGHDWVSEVDLRVPRLITRNGLRAAGELTWLGHIASRDFDLLHSVALTAPLRTKAANVVVLADVTWIVEPDMGKGQGPTVRLWRATVPRVARRADRVIAISESSATQISEHVGVPRDRVDVTPLGYAPSAAPVRTAGPELRARLGLSDGPLLLNVGAKKVHKNQMRIIEALVAVRRRVPGAQLMLAGAETPYQDEMRARASELGLGEAVRFAGYVSAEDLEGLYDEADVFVFPSLSEGFGLPLLEAMARDLPVVTSNVSALPEVAGDAALQVDPRSPGAIAAAIAELLTDPGLRDRLIAGGRERVGRFTWAATAQATLESWERAL